MIRFSDGLIDRLLDHARTDYPHECCGAMFGRFESNGDMSVDEALPLSNGREDAHRHNRFAITVDDVRSCEAKARHRGVDLIGFYHSHPDHPAVPSDFDRDNALPFYLYPIVSVHGGEATVLRCWTLSPDRSSFLEHAFETTDLSPLTQDQTP